MPNMTPDRLGQINGAGDTRALFLKVFGGEVITAYDEVNVMDALHWQRMIESGKSAAFPMTGKIGAGYHTPGVQLLGNQRMNKNEIIINVDDLLVSDVFIPNIDELLNYVDYRQIISKQVGEALARAKDRRALQAAVLAARSAHPVTGMPGGSVIVAATARTDMNVLANAIVSAAIALDEKDAPATGRSIILRPAQTHLAAQSDRFIHRDRGLIGNAATGETGTLDNIRIVKSNNVPNTNIVSAVSGENNTYFGNFTNTVGVVMQEQAIGTVKLLDLTVEMTGSDVAILYQGTMIVGKYVQGTGILNPAAAVEIAVA
jgi:hypothetical protein